MEKDPLLVSLFYYCIYCGRYTIAAGGQVGAVLHAAEVMFVCQHYSQYSLGKKTETRQTNCLTSSLKFSCLS